MKYADVAIIGGGPAGMAAALAAREAGAGKVGLRAVACASESLDQLHEIRFASRHRIGIALFVERGLPLINHTQNGIVEDHGDDRQIVGNRRTCLIQIHVERPVSGQMHDTLIRIPKLRADCCAIAEAHGAQSAAGQEVARFRLLHILCRPHLMLSDICHKDRLLVRIVCTHACDDLLWI